MPLLPAMQHAMCRLRHSPQLTLFASCRQVLFHLQTRQPAVLPPVCELFPMLRIPDDSSRPLHSKRPANMALLEVNNPSPRDA